MLHEVFVEQLAHQALGEHVLDEHFVDGSATKVGVERFLADFHKGGIGRFEGGVAVMSLGDALGQPFGQGGDFGTEIGDGL